jgi:hypothetical protein
MKSSIKASNIRFSLLKFFRSLNAFNKIERPPSIKQTAANNSKIKDCVLKI